MALNKQKLELTWIGKENRPKLEPRILVEDAEKSYHAPHRVAADDRFDARDNIGKNRARLIGRIEGKLPQGSTRKPLLHVRWNLK